MKLNAAKLRTLTRPGTFGDGAGLYLQVRGPGQRSWIFRYKVGGKGRLMGLGALAEVSLAEARDATQAARKLLRSGVDPLDDKRRRRAEAATKIAAQTFEQTAEQYITAHEASWRNEEHRRQWHTTLAHDVNPIFGRRPVADIGVGDVMKALEPIWQAKPETASRVRGRIEAVLDYAAARGWRTGENPARWRGHLKNLLPSRRKLAPVKHHAALPWPDIGAMMLDLRNRDGIPARALEFLILTAARSGEVLGARWSEIDLNARVWTVPSTRMKAGREHRVPLSDAALDVLRQMETLASKPAPDAHIFPGVRPRLGLSKTTLFRELRHLGRDSVTVHGFRSSFRMWCAEATNYPREVAEQALAHTVGSAAELAYQRSDHLERRRRLMAEWAELCARTHPNTAGAGIITLHAAI